MDPYRETNKIEARFRKIEGDIADLKRTPRGPTRRILSRFTDSQVYMLLVIYFIVTLCTTCGILLAIGYDEPITKGIGFSMIPSSVISFIAAISAARKLSRKKDE